MVSASAIGYYGDRGNELLTEEERARNHIPLRCARSGRLRLGPAREAGVRVVHPRFGIVLSTEGGALGTTYPSSSSAEEARSGQVGSTGPGSRSTTWLAPSFTS